MGRKKKTKEESGSWTPPSFAFASTETMRGVWAILLTVIALFFVLAAFDFAGSVGGMVFHGLAFLFGIGYALLPIALIMLAIVLMRAREHTFSAARSISVILFLLAGLGLVDIGLPGRGGIIGSLITKPFILGLDTIASILFLGAFAIIAVMVAFDIDPLTLWRSFTTPKESLDIPEEEEDIEPMIDEPNEEDIEPEEEDEEMEVPEKKSLWGKKSEEEDLPIFQSHFGSYTPPPLSLLSKNKGKPSSGDIKANANTIKRALQNFGIEVEMDEVSIGPTVTRYSMKPAEGVRLAKIVGLQSNIELALAAAPVRIEAPIPGKSLVGIEVPNSSRTTLGLAPLLSNKEFIQSDKSLLMALGSSITGVPHYTDLARAPHMLVAGATGAGKSVTVHGIITSLLYRCGPEQLRFVMVDPKRVELTLYNPIPHLLTPVITDAKKAILALKWLAKEMDRRYDLLETERVRDIGSYHENVVKPALAKHAASGEEDTSDLPEAMPYIVVIIDELADIMQAYPRELEAGIVRLAQMSRAVGIHLILSTQRPSVKVITGLIKANIPARLALQVSSQIDSRTILDMGGAEKLLGAGDMLFLSGEMSKPRRLQAPYISEREVKDVVHHIAKSYEHIIPDTVEFTNGEDTGGGTDPLFAALDEGTEDDDELYPEAKQAVLEAGKASTSYLQRKLRIGYSRAARLIDILEDHGIIGPADGSKPREVLIQSSSSSDENESPEEDESLT